MIFLVNCISNSILQPELNVREKILLLINAWQEALPRIKYPQYHAAYNEILVIACIFIYFSLSLCGICQASSVLKIDTFKLSVNENVSPSEFVQLHDLCSN